MNEALETAIDQVKLAKAYKAFDDGVATYGSISDRLKSLDCKTRDEAARMLKFVQKVRVYKVAGRVVVE